MKLFFNLFLLLLIIVAIFLFATGTLQDAVKSWKDRSKKTSDNVPAVIVPSTASPSPTGTAHPSASPTVTPSAKASFTPYSQQKTNEENDLPKTGPALDLGIALGAGVVGYGTYRYFQIKRRYARTAGKVDIL